MARRKLAGFAVKYGVKYGPHVVVLARTFKEPATAYAQRTLAGNRARKAALAEAATLTDGSALKVFHEGEPVWVVYSGAEPVSAHPAVTVPPAALVQRADLTRRIRPEGAPPPSRRRLALRRRR